MSDPMPTIIDTLRGAAAIHKAEAQDRRADLVGMFERHADWHDGKAWIPVETAADLVVDRDAEIAGGEVEWGLCDPDTFPEPYLVGSESTIRRQLVPGSALRVVAHTVTPWIEVQL